MTTYTPELHARLRELHQQASPAPWVADEDDDQRYLRPDGDEVINTDAAHIRTIDTHISVESRNALPALLDEIERLTEEMKKSQSKAWQEGYRARRTFEAQHRISAKFGKDFTNEPTNPYQENN